MIDRLEAALKKIVVAVLRPIFSSRAGTINPGVVREILVVRQHDQLGDMICSVPLLRALKQKFPGSRLTLIASPVSYEIMLNNPYVDELINYDKAELRTSISKS